MTWQVLLYMLAQLAAAVLCLAAMRYVWRQRNLPRNRAGAVFLVAGAEWALASALETACFTNLPLRVLLAKLGQVGVTTVPWALLVYALYVTGRERWLTRRHMVLLGLIPAACLALALTNEGHGLIWRQYTLRIDSTGVWSHVEYGVGAWVFIAYLYGTVAAAAWMISQSLGRTQRVGRRPGVLTLAMFVLPATVGLGQVFFLPNLNLAPIAFGLFVTPLARMLVRARRESLLPVARELVLDSLADAMFVLDAEHRLVDLNPSACALVGQSKEHALGHPLREFWPAPAATLEAILSSSDPTRDLVVCQGDNPRTYDVRVSSLRDWEGHLMGQILVLRDITEREEANKMLQHYREHLEELVATRTGQLQRSEERLQILFDYAPDAYYLTDLQGTLVDGNKAAEELVGYPKEELVGQSFARLLPPEQLGVITALLTRNALGARTGPDEITMIRKDTTPVPVEVSGFPVEIAGQTLVLGIARDISERAEAERRRARAEEELRRAHDELELRVQERTQELAAANGALRGSVQEKEVLLKEIHHRVKNNLQIISSLLTLQAGKLQDPEVSALFQESQTRVRSMALIHEKLYRSADLATVDFGEYLVELTNYLRRSYPANTAHIRVEVAAEEVRLTVDLRLRQAARPRRDAG